MMLGSHVLRRRHIPTDKKTRKRGGDVAADQAKYGDSCSARRIDTGPTRLTRVSKIAEPSLAPVKCISDALFNEGAEVAKPHLPPVEVERCGRSTR